MTDDVAPAEGPDAVLGAFTHAVASFDPTTGGALLWTRVVGASRLRWWVSADPSGSAVLTEGEVDVAADDDGCVTVDAVGLEPATTYHYGFEVIDPPTGEVSPVGRTRTLPDGPTEEVRLGVVCCADVTNGWFTVYRAVATHEVDLVVHLGDYIYETEGKGHLRSNQPDRTVVSLDDYRTRFAHTRADPDLLALHLRHPVVFVWDDHDVADNAWRHGAKEHDPGAHGPWEDRLAAAARARQEWLPARLRDPGDRLAMWRSLPLGALAELVVLDTRIPGRDRQAGDEGAKTLDDPDRHLLDPAQRRWAHERIADASRPWCLVATAVTMSPMWFPIGPQALRGTDRAMPSGYAVVDGHAVCTDEWDGYPAERTALAEVMARRGGGSVVLSGDVHSSWAFEAPCDPAGRAVAVEFVCPSVTSTPMARHLPGGASEALEAEGGRLAHRRWSELSSWGWLRLTVRADVVQADWFGVDPDRPKALLAPLASWLAQPGLPARLVEADAPLQPLSPRPGLPLGTLPARPVPPGRPRHPGLRRRLTGAAMAIGLAAVMGGMLAARHRAAQLAQTARVAVEQARAAARPGSPRPR